MSRHVSKQIAIAKKLYTRGDGKSIHFLKALSALSKKFKMGSIGIPSKILESSVLESHLWHRIRTCRGIFDIMSTFKNTDS